MAINQEPSIGGPRSATAATFQVNDASLKGLHQTFDLLTKDVGKFNAALISLGKGNKTLDETIAKLHKLGMGGGGSGSGAGTAGGGGQGGSNGGTASFSNHGSIGGNVSIWNATTTNTGSSAAATARSADDRGAGWRTSTKVFTGVGAAAAAVGSYYNRSMGTISDADLLYTQGAQSTGYSRAASNANQRFVSGLGGFQSGSDLTQGIGTITGALGGGLGNARTNFLAGQVGNLAAAMPGMGYAGAAAGAAQLYNPATAQRLRGLGVTPTGSRGALQSPSAIYAKIQRMVFRGQKVTPNMIAEGMQPGAPLFATLQGLGLDQTGMEAFRDYALTMANLNGDPVRTDAALHAAATGHSTRDTKLAGLTDSVRANQNRAGMADTKRSLEAGAEGKDALQDSFSQLARVSNDLTDAFRKLNGATGGHSGYALGVSGVLGGPLSSTLGQLGGIGGAGFAVNTLKDAWRGFRGGGVRGGIKGGARTAAGLSGAQGTPVYVTNWPGGGFGGSGGGGGVGDLLGEAGGKGKGKLLDKLAGKAGRLGKFGRMFGGVAEGAEGAAGVGAVGEAGAAGISGLAAVGVAAAPVVAVGAVAAGLTYGAVKAMHAGWFSWAGIDGDKTIKDRNDYANDNRLTNAVHSLTTGGYMQLPDCKDEWKTRVEPLVRAAHDKSSAARALKAVNDLKAKYQARVDEVRSRRNFRPYETNVDPSFGVGQPGGAAIGVGDGKSSAGSATNTRRPAGNGASAVISTAESFLGKPYRWGGSNPRTSFDCSGLMQWSYGQHGIKLPRTAAQQQHVGSDVPIDQLAPGDLVFYGSPAHHVAMNLGGGKMLEAPHTGANIRITGLRKPTNAKRVLGAGPNDFNGVLATGSTSGPQGDSGDAPAGYGAPSRNMATAPGVFADEASAFASLLSQGMGNGPSVATGSSHSLKRSSTTGGGGSSSNAQAGSMPVGDAMSNARIIVQVAKQMGLSKRGAIIGIATAEQESGLRNLHDGDRDSQGLFQQRPSQGWGSVAQVTNPAHAAASFFARLKGTDYEHLPLTVAAQKVQRSGYPNAYAKWEQTAAGIVNQIGYRAGSWDIDSDQTASLHKGEIVIPAHMARRARSEIASQQALTRLSPGSSSAAASGRGVTVTIHAPITLVGRATQQDAKEFLGMVKQEMSQDRTLAAMGAG